MDTRRDRTDRYPWTDSPAVMGIINSSSDSFFEDGIQETVDRAVSEARRMVEAGADVVDVGGESNSPGSEALDAEAEIDRVVPVVERLSDLAAMVSVDTWKAEVASAAIAAGADVINDVSGLEDPEMADVAAKHDVPLVVMHSVNVIVDPEVDLTVEYDDVVAEVCDHLEDRVAVARAAGVPEDRIVVDPGIGFGKTIEQSAELIARLGEIERLGYPVLVGHSRKMTFEHVGGDPEDCLPATIAVTAAAVERGADVVRVHDVPENVEAVRVGEAMRRYDASRGRHRTRRDGTDP